MVAEHLDVTREALDVCSDNPQAQAPDAWTGLVDIMEGASLLLHEADEFANNGDLPKAFCVGDKPFDASYINNNKLISVLRFLGRHSGQSFTNTEIYDALYTQDDSVNKRDPASWLYEFRKTRGPNPIAESLIASGSNGFYSYTMPFMSDTMEHVPLSQVDGIEQAIGLGAHALLHCRVEMAESPAEVNAIDIRTSALEILQKSSKMVRNHLGKAADRGAVGVVLLDDQEDETLDLTGANGPSLNAIWDMTDELWHTVPLPELKKYFKSNSQWSRFLERVRTPGTVENKLHPLLLRSGNPKNPELGLRGWREQPGVGEIALDADLYVSNKDRISMAPPREAVGKARHPTHRLPRIEIDTSALPPLNHPDRDLDANAATITVTGKEFDITQFSGHERTLVAYLVANPGRWITEEDMTTLLPELASSTLNRLLQRVVYQVAAWQLDEHPARDNHFEKYVEVAKSPDRVCLVRFDPESPAGWTGYKEAGLGWLVDGLDPNKKIFNMGGYAIDVSGLDPNTQSICQIILNNPSRGFGLNLIREMFVSCTLEQSRQSFAARLLNELQDPRHPLYPVAHISAPDSERHRTVWASGDRMGAERRFNLSLSDAPDHMAPPDPLAFNLGDFDAEKDLYEGEIEFMNLILDPSRELVLQKGIEAKNIRRVLGRLAGLPALDDPAVSERFRLVNVCLTRPEGVGESAITLLGRLSGDIIPHVWGIQELRGFNNPDAACRYTEDVDKKFFPDRTASNLPAKILCLERCPLLLECTAFALDNAEEIGVWGGMSGRQRERILKMYEERQDAGIILAAIEQMWEKDRQAIQKAREVGKL